MSAAVDRLRAALAVPRAESSDFDLNPGLRPPEHVLRAAGVLVAVTLGSTGPRVILTKRASGLKHHPGQIALPGGKVEPVDSGPEAAALREAEEEIGLASGNVEVLGALPRHRTVTGFAVTPVVGRVLRPFEARPEAGEVEEVFDVPLGHLLDLRRYSVETRLWRGQPRRYYAVPWGPYYIWGATARILRGLAERMPA